jgi:hypothetical protein
MSTATRITISHLKNVLLSAGTTVKTPLGRWSVHKNKNHGLVVDYSNEDHCGSCGDYITTKRDSNKSFDEKEELLELEYSNITVNTPN